jgi:REP element-mobilizing transposase RayT
MPAIAHPPRRRSIRLPGYDYASAGAYFVTICAEDRVRCFGEIIDSQVHLSPAGEMIDATWRALVERFPFIDLDAYVIMRNHFHAIVVLCDPVRGQSGETRLGEIMGAFKSLTTHEYVLGVRHKGWPPFPRRLWQRNYYEHIIRSEPSLNAIRQYIADNPARWALDPENAPPMKNPPRPGTS